MLKILHAACLGLSLVISVQFTFKMCAATRNRKKVNKTPILVFKVIHLSIRVYDFLLVIGQHWPYVAPLLSYNGLLIENGKFSLTFFYLAPLSGLWNDFFR